MHADNYFQGSLAEMLVAHNERIVGLIGTAGTFITSTPEQCGVLVLNEDKTIAEFHEKVVNPPSKIANAAIYIFTPKIRHHVLSLPDFKPDISRDLIPKVFRDLCTFHFSGLFMDIGTPENLKQANILAKN
jgi:mannose-1-phosphate guanylyltransferase